jgi:DNA-binding SARP family transcriptional activator/CheY-like chemotaxis protein
MDGQRRGPPQWPLVSDEQARRPLIEFRLLGPVEAWRAGRRVELGGPKPRAVLTSLLVRAGRVVSVEQLIDDLWPEHPPSRAAATVQVFVSNLRRALEPGRPRGAPATVLVTAARGYRLNVEPEAVDAHEFALLAAQGRAALEGDDPERAAELLLRAAELWRGPAFADVPEVPFALAEAARLEELRLAAIEDRVDAELALGRHTALVAELERSVRQHPTRERLRAQLMLAFYRCGRQADALATYRSGRQALRQELGLEPGTRLQELEQAVLRHNPDLAWEPPAPVMLPAERAESSGAEPGRVLVVDDSGVNRRLLVAALTELGHEVRSAENGRRALELLRDRGGSGGYDVVLLDLLMPVMDGYTTLTEIKADPAIDHIPVIMVSAVPDMESVVRCIELGATDYLPKPFSSAVLRARLRSSLAAKRLRDVERDHLSRMEEMVAAGPDRLADESSRDDVVGRLARRLRGMSREVAERETALRAEIAALQTEVDRARATAGAATDQR